MGRRGQDAAEGGGGGSAGASGSGPSGLLGAPGPHPASPPLPHRSPRARRRPARPIAAQVGRARGQLRRDVTARPRRRPWQRHFVSGGGAGGRGRAMPGGDRARRPAVAPGPWPRAACAPVVPFFLCAARVRTSPFPPTKSSAVAVAGRALRPFQSPPLPPPSRRTTLNRRADPRARPAPRPPPRAAAPPRRWDPCPHQTGRTQRLRLPPPQQYRPPRWKRPPRR